jgi:hypothetical protein
MNPYNNQQGAFDSTTQYLSDLDASRAAYAVAVLLVASTSVVYLLKRSGFRAMVAVGRG